MTAMKRMKAFATFDEYAAEQTPRNLANMLELRKLVKRVAPGLRETVKWGNGCWVRGKENVAFVFSASDHVQFGFFGGSDLKDPKGLLEGAGQYVRHIKVHATTKIDERAFASLLKQAAGLP